jgi:tetratricopeptide (TPR) repeat protein
MLGAEKLKACDYQVSYDWLLNAIELNKIYSEPYVNKFVGALGDSYYKLGYIRQKQGRPEDALIHYLDLIKIANTWEMELALVQIINIIEKQPEEEIILFVNSIIDISKKEYIECILRVLKKTKLHKAFVYYALKYNKEFDGQNETTYIAMILSGQAEAVVETAIDVLKNQAVELEAYNWHLDYAVAAIIYSKRIDLFNKNKIYFKPVQKVIIEAYLINTDIIEVNCSLEKEFSKISGIIYFLLREEELDKYKMVFSKLIKESD